MTTTLEQPTLAVRNLDISYRRGTQESPVVRDVSFTIRPGEAYGLVGESGCGKTTVAMSIMRYLPDNATVGDGSGISFSGEDVLGAGKTALRQWRGGRIAMVYQNPGASLNPSMRVGAQVAEGIRVHSGLSGSECKRKALEMLAKVRIPDPEAVAARYPHELSGGQQQRVMIAMALSGNPDLLVLDEPTTGLDATVEAEVLELIRQLREEFHTAVLFISHNLGIVAQICDRVGVLYAGRLVEEAPAAELFAAPQHPYTRDLLRSVPRHGVTKTAGMLATIPGSLPAPGTALSGCPYAARCELATERCHTETPPVETVGSEHAVSCFHHDEVAQDRAVERFQDCARETEVLLEVRNLTKRYRTGGREFTAVSDVSFELHRGEVFGLVGESGSGKTTIAKCIAGMTRPSEGALRFEDVTLTKRPGREERTLRRKIQMVFQNPDNALNPRHPVRRIISRAVTLLNGRLRGQAREDRVEELTSAVRLEPRHLDVRPRALSGGLKQRVAIARAFAGEPSLVLCDEPVSALDVSVQAAILNLLVELQVAKDVAYLFISHDMSVVRYLADRIGVLYLGQLVEIGTADAVFQPPHHPYTEALLSAAPDLDPGQTRERIRLDGTYPSASAPPSGCRFHTRCPRQLGEICRTQEPPWQDTGKGNTYRCHIAPQDLLRRIKSE
ncbi:ABC transporter ATP-binding protein [Amycolatopsis sp. DSM 110486]|uniref:dipeptide ABC transporter ATP-binding protein n=1 Tax=Amycolatopsis sp. DSM 110486 TaxID=2865832 RepID=UPI001C69DC35|nr:ABC transporter ATP-binding protein [Amycolatopsis sp. DSM 110486]QYN18723.1 ABC transporter ATP-binding protein [Amycolatopsis sp. DSM 110486]